MCGMVEWWCDDQDTGHVINGCLVWLPAFCCYVTTLGKLFTFTLITKQ